jgi:hypothetical protein
VISEGKALVIAVNKTDLLSAAEVQKRTYSIYTSRKQAANKTDLLSAALVRGQSPLYVGIFIFFSSTFFSAYTPLAPG